MTNEEFRVLLLRIKSNDIAALGDIYNEYFQKLRYTSFCIVKDYNVAYDIAMNALLKFVDYPFDVNSIRNYVGLLIKITKNESLNYVKREKRQVEFDVNFKRFQYIPNDNLWIKDVITELTEEENEVFIEHCICGLRLKVIAKKLGKSYINVVRIYSRIKYKLKQLYS